MFLPLLILVPRYSNGQEIAETQKPECSCIQTARNAGVPIPIGTDAEHIKNNSYPVIGGLVLFYYPKSNIYHTAIIKEFREKGFWVYEGNFKACKTDYRLISYNDPFIIGFTKSDQIAIKDTFLVLSIPKKP